jgi:hypothetical protein
MSSKQMINPKSSCEAERDSNGPMDVIVLVGSGIRGDGKCRIPGQSAY